MKNELWMWSGVIAFLVVLVILITSKILETELEPVSFRGVYTDIKDFPIK
jgi:hypothetical protein